MCYTVEDGVLIKYVDTDITYACEAVTVIYTRAELSGKTGDGLPCDGKSCPGKVFADMPPKGNWAHDAIDWAVVNKVTAGTSAAAFSPENTCTRAQVVTFLYRDVVK